MRVLDELMADQIVPRPDFLKLDVQGYELEVLKGGERSIRDLRPCCWRSPSFRSWTGMPLAANVVQFLERRGFLWFDVMGIFRRPQDDALMQMDVLFLRSGHPLDGAGSHDWPRRARAPGTGEGDELGPVRTLRKVMGRPVRLLSSKALEWWCLRRGRVVGRTARTFWGEPIRVILPDPVSLTLYRYGFFEEELTRIFLHGSARA